MRDIINTNLIKHFNIDMDNVKDNEIYVKGSNYLYICGFKLNLTDFTLHCEDVYLEFSDYMKLSRFISDVKKDLSKNKDK